MLSVGGAGFGYDESGAGPAILLVHAGCSDRRMWIHQMRPLAREHRAIRYDWRGYGESDDTVAPVSRHGDLLAVLDALAVDRAVVIGASDGGRAALDATLTAPERIAGLILLAPGLSGYAWPASMLERYRDRVHASIGIDRLRGYRTGATAAIDPLDLDTYCRAETEYLVAGPDRSLADLPQQVRILALDMDRDLTRRTWSHPPVREITLDPPCSGRLNEITVPVLVINGLSDVPEIIDVSRKLAATIPAVRHIELPDTGHLPALEQPERVNAAMLEFLAVQRSAGRWTAEPRESL